MQCPEDGSTLQTTDYRGVPIEECPKCFGRWFDRDELRAARDRTDDDLRWLDFDPFAQQATGVAVSERAKRCPKDGTAMEGLPYRASGVVIERCRDCEGIWLNHGEFEKIVGYLEGLVARKRAPELARDTLRQMVQVVTGPEGVVSELRDLLAVLHLLELRIAVEQPRIAQAAEKIYRVSPFK